MSEEKPVSQRAFAKLLEVSHTAVARAIEAGRLDASLVWPPASAKRRSPKIRPTLGREEWEASRVRAPGERAPKAAAKSGDAKGQTLLPGIEPEPEPSDEAKANAESRSSYQGHRAERERWEAELSRLKFRQRAGELVEASEVRAAAADLGVQVREAILGAVDRIAPAIAKTKGARAVRQRLRRELTEILRGLDDPATLGQILGDE